MVRSASAGRQLTLSQLGVELTMRLVSVAVPVPLLGPLTYALPDGRRGPAGRRACARAARHAHDDRLRARHGQWRRRRGLRQSTRSRKSSTSWTIDHSCRTTSWRLRRGSRTTTRAASGEAVAAAMPPRAWIESERHAQITEAGRVRIGGERGLRRHGAGEAPGRRAGPRASIARAGRGVHAALVTLERDGLVSLTQPLKGQASAYRTVRVVTLTAQGHDIAGSDDEPSTPAGPTPVPAERLRASSSESASAPRSISCKELRMASTPRSCGAKASARKRSSALRRSAWLRFRRERVERDPFEVAAARVVQLAAVVLTDEQSSGARGVDARWRRRERFSRSCCTA